MPLMPIKQQKGPPAARADLVIVCHVNIKDQLSLERLELARLDLLVVLWFAREDRADIDLVRVHLLNVLSHLLLGGVTPVADVHVCSA